jgi:hypothetical protein
VSSINSSRRWRLWAVLLVGVVGCAPSEPADDRLAAVTPEAMVPVSGVVTANGKPVDTVVITFLPPNGPGVGTGETDKDGKYTLSSVGGPGILPGDYKVAISYLVSDTGEPQGLRPRSSMAQPPGMRTAKEQIPPEYSDLGRTKLTARVDLKGGHFDFDVPISISATEPKPPGKKVEDAKPDEAKTREAKPDEAKPAEPKSTEKNG